MDDDDKSKLGYVCGWGIQTNLTVEEVTPRITWCVGAQWLEITKAHHDIAGRGKGMEMVVRGRYRCSARKVGRNGYQRRDQTLIYKDQSSCSYGALKRGLTV